MATKMKRFAAPGPAEEARAAAAANGALNYSCSPSSSSSSSSGAAAAAPQRDAPEDCSRDVDEELQASTAEGGEKRDSIEAATAGAAEAAAAAEAGAAAAAAEVEVTAAGLLQRFSVSSEVYAWGRPFSLLAAEEARGCRHSSKAIKANLKASPAAAAAAVLVLGLRLRPFGLQPAQAVRQLDAAARHVALLTDDGRVYVLADAMYPWQEAYGSRWHVLPASLQRPFSQVSISSGCLAADPLAFLDTANTAAAAAAATGAPGAAAAAKAPTAAEPSAGATQQQQQDACDCCCCLQDPARGRCYCHLDAAAGDTTSSSSSTSSSTRVLRSLGKQQQQLHCPLQREHGRLPLQQQSKATENHVPCILVSLPDEGSLTKQPDRMPGAPSAAAAAAATAAGAPVAAAAGNEGIAGGGTPSDVPAAPAADAAQSVSAAAAGAAAATTAAAAATTSAPAEGGSVWHAAVLSSRLFPGKFGLLVKGRRHSRLFCPLPHKPAKLLCGPGGDVGLLLLANGQLLQWGIRRSLAAVSWSASGPQPRGTSLFLSQVRGSLEGRAVVDIALGSPLPAWPHDASPALEAFAVCSSGILHEFSLGGPLADAGGVAGGSLGAPQFARLRPPIPEPIEFTPLSFELLYGHPNSNAARIPYLPSNFRRLLQAVSQAELDALLPTSSSNSSSNKADNSGNSSSTFERLVDSFWLQEVHGGRQPGVAAAVAGDKTAAAAADPRGHSAEAEHAAAAAAPPRRQSLATATSGLAAGVTLEPQQQRQQQQQQLTQPQGRVAAGLRGSGAASPEAAAKAAAVLGIPAGAAAGGSPTEAGGPQNTSPSGVSAAHLAAFQRLREAEISRLYSPAAAAGAAAAGPGGPGTAAGAGAAASDPLQHVWCCGGFLLLARASGRLAAAHRGIVSSGTLRRRQLALSRGLNAWETEGTLRLHCLEQLTHHHIKQVLELHRHLGLGACVAEGLAGRALRCLGSSVDLLPPSPPPPSDALQLLQLQLAAAAKPPYSICCGPGCLLLSVSSVLATPNSSSSSSRRNGTWVESTEEMIKKLEALTRIAVEPRSIPKALPMGYGIASPLRRLAEAVWHFTRLAAKEAAAVQQLRLQLCSEFTSLAQQHDEELLQALQQQQQQQEEQQQQNAAVNVKPEEGEPAAPVDPQGPSVVSVQRRHETQLRSLLLLLLSRVFVAQGAASAPGLLHALKQQHEAAREILEGGDDPTDSSPAKRPLCSAHVKRPLKRRPPPAEPRKLRKDNDS
ncbi:hypothetical protein Esti_004087 [Eimeria stiedai]